MQARIAAIAAAGLPTAVIVPAAGRTIVENVGYLFGQHD
jgi:hypothetical protein